MFQRLGIFLVVVFSAAQFSLWAQQPCPSFSITVDSPEDHLMLAVNGADGPKDQIAALDKFVQAHADSKFMPCVNEYYAAANLKLNNFDQSIEYGEKDLAVNYQDLNLLLTLMRAYAGSTKVSDTIFTVINKVPDQVKTEIGNPIKPQKATDEEWAKIQKDAQELAKDSHDYAIWAFFQVLPRVTDGAKRVQELNDFVKAYPEAEKDNALQINTIYFQAYQMQGDLPKTIEFGDKVIAIDPNNVSALNTVGLIYTFYAKPPAPDKGAAYAQKALTALQTRQKPNGMDDATFTKDQNLQMGTAHLIVGYAALTKAQKTQRLLPAITELKAAAPLLADNPTLQQQALYFLANAYEMGAPANHVAAKDALNKAISLPGPMQDQARGLLAKVKAAR